MNKQFWLLKLRRCTSIDTLERVIEHHKYNTISEVHHEGFYSAADHRLAGLTVGRNFDRIPASIWKLVK